MARLSKAAVLLALGLMSVASAGQAGVEVSGAWARATMPGQKVAGIYLQLRSDVQAKLIGVRSTAAKATEIHRMSNEDGVMRMRRVDSLDLPAGKTVALEPGGYHVMLLDIHRPLKVGDDISVTLVIEAQGKRLEVPVQAQVRSVQEEGDVHRHHQ